jgi:hypothetical protein
MTEIIGTPSGHIGTGSALLLVDQVPLATAEIRTSAPIATVMASKIGIDIAADRNCTVKIVRLPDGDTPGEVSDVGSVVAGTPKFLLYTSLLCPAIQIVIENTGGADMTELAMYVRGAA